jgi:hypothetical protein
MPRKEWGSVPEVSGLALFTTTSSGEEKIKRQWQTSACFNFSLSVWDKKSQGRYLAKYVVTAADGKVFVAEKKAGDNPDTAEVIFPDNFRDKDTDLKAWINCGRDERYAWEMYADGLLVESGTFVTSRKKTKVSNPERLQDSIVKTLM